MAITMEFLHDEALENIYGHLNLTSLARSEQVCKRWKQIINGGHISVWVKLFNKKFDYSVIGNNASEIKECYQRQFRLLRNVRDDKMIRRFIPDMRSHLGIAPLISREYVIFFLSQQRIGKLNAFKPLIPNSRKKPSKINVKTTLGSYLETSIGAVFRKSRSKSKHHPEWTVSSRLSFKASLFPKYSSEGLKNKRSQGWLETGSSLCFLGGESILKKAGKAILVSNQYFYTIWTADLRCEFAMNNSNRFLIRDGDTVYHQEGSRLVSYSIAKREYTGSMNILSESEVLPQFTYVFSGSNILVPTSDGRVMMCDWPAKKVVWEKKITESELIDVEVTQDFLVLLTDKGVFTVVSLKKGKTIQDFRFEPFEGKHRNYQKKILGGDEHFLIPYKDNKTLEGYKYGEQEPLFQKTYTHQILSVLVEKQRFAVFLHEGAAHFFCQINHLKTGAEIANVPLPEMKTARATMSISDQILFVSYPLEENNEFSHCICFINLANGKVLNKKFFKKSHKVSHISFKDGLLTYRTHVEGATPKWVFHDFKAQGPTISERVSI